MPNPDADRKAQCSALLGDPYLSTFPPPATVVDSSYASISIDPTKILEAEGNPLGLVAMYIPAPEVTAARGITIDMQDA